MHRLRLFQVFWLESGIPNCVHDLLVVHFFEYSVASNHDEIKVVFDLKGTDFRNGNHYVWISAIPLVLCLNIPNCPWDRQTSWKHTMGTYQGLCACVVARCRIGNKRLILVHLTSTTLNPFCFGLILWFVIDWKGHNFCSLVRRHESSAVSHVCDIGNLAND